MPSDNNKTRATVPPGMSHLERVRSEIKIPAPAPAPAPAPVTCGLFRAAKENNKERTLSTTTSVYAELSYDQYMDHLNDQEAPSF
jgi:hypothetical protein